MAAALAPRLPERVALIGLSLGGLVARAFAAAHPERVAALVTFGTLPAAELVPAGVRRGRRLAGLLPDALFRWTYARRIGRRMAEEVVSPELCAQLVADLPPREEILGRLDAIFAWGLPHQIGVPALWLRGESDAEAPWTAADITRLLPEVSFETVPGGHRAPLTHPEGFHAAIMRFLTGRA